MLLTITYQGHNTQDLGYLLHKNPQRAQQFELSYGKAYVFYPEVSDERTTAALLLDIDPIDLARGKVGSLEGGLFDYVNDRPYASTSFMSTAMARIFGTAMSGKCDKRQELADTPLQLTAQIFSLKDGGDENLASQLFQPLGYTVKTERTVLDSQFPEWGKSPYINLTISGTVKLSTLLNQIYVLIPVFDRQKHYFISEDEIQKLINHSEGWLANHPYREKIAQRYFAIKKSYARRALDKLLSEEGKLD
ncbi:MAG: 3' terminal RNA ribose 2'-O-methyltransferase Hen1 [Clostridia bacterium]|nr:3' terminal RNA ribose 2'-O-methyltransferase Hen1 [Clostridia bacterium]